MDGTLGAVWTVTSMLFARRITVYMCKHLEKQTCYRKSAPRVRRITATLDTEKLTLSFDISSETETTQARHLRRKALPRGYYIFVSNLVLSIPCRNLY